MVVLDCQCVTASDPLLYSYGEAARLLGVSARTVRRLVAAEQLRSVVVGSAKRIPRAELLRLIDTPDTTQEVAL